MTNRYHFETPRLRAPGAKGYTLVEVLVVVAVIGILAAIAVPQFASYREQSYCASTKTDLTGLARHQESYFVDNDTYLAATVNADRSSNVPNHRWTEGVSLVSSTGTNAEWTVVVNHANCSKGPYTYNSSQGGIQ